MSVLYQCDICHGIGTYEEYRTTWFRVSVNQALNDDYTDVCPRHEELLTNFRKPAKLASRR